MCLGKMFVDHLKEKHHLLGIGAIGISYYSSVLQDKEIFEDNISLNNKSQEDEEIYLERNKQLLKDKYTENMTKFKENSKISLLMGFYVAIVIILLIV